VSAKRLEIVRIFDASRVRVFEMWSTPAHLQMWSAPNGFTIPDARMDFREGGSWYAHMRSPGGEDHRVHGKYLEIVDGARIVSRGLSAGGLLQGAVFNQAPDRWRGVVAEVAFVDVVTTMLDASIPLTVNEWDEWGDPRVREQFDAMLAYSPYDNPPPAGSRPDLLVTGAVHDTRVLVHEPAKWVARLRETDPEWAPQCLFRAETGTGSHVGPSGRLDHLAYEADVATWLLDRLGVTS